MRPNAPSNANVNNTHHQEHLRTFANFRIINIIVNIFDSFCALVIPHYDYIRLFGLSQQMNYNHSSAHVFNSSCDTSVGKRLPVITVAFGASVCIRTSASAVVGVLPDVANGIIFLPAKS